jgi:hypothetical protein
VAYPLRGTVLECMILLAQLFQNPITKKPFTLNWTLTSNRDGLKPRTFLSRWLRDDHLVMVLEKVILFDKPCSTLECTHYSPLKKWNLFISLVCQKQQNAILPIVCCASYNRTFFSILQLSTFAQSQSTCLFLLHFDISRKKRSATHCR